MPGKQASFLRGSTKLLAWQLGQAGADGIRLAHTKAKMTKDSDDCLGEPADYALACFLYYSTPSPPIISTGKYYNLK